MNAENPWIELDGTVNVRDLGGSPAGRRAVQPHRLIRADNLQDLSPEDVRRLRDDYGIKRVIDLRSDVEVTAEGPGPLTAERRIRIAQLSLFPDSDAVQVVDSTAGPEVLPWQNVSAEDEGRADAVAGYLRFLTDRPDNVVAALRIIAETLGGTLVHCAAGKDRTGVVIAMALAAVGVPDETIVADYARSGERIELIVGRLASSPTYVDDILSGPLDRHRPLPATMQRFLSAVRDTYGSVSGWLTQHGWTPADQTTLEHALLDE